MILQRMYQWTGKDYYDDNLAKTWIFTWFICLIGSLLLFYILEINVDITLKNMLVTIGVLYLIMHGGACLQLNDEVIINHKKRRAFWYMLTLCLYAIGILGFFGMALYKHAPIGYYLAIVFVSGEILFFIEKDKPKTKHLFWYTVGKKLTTFTELVLFLTALNGIIYVIINIAKELYKYHSQILHWTLIILYSALGMGIIVGILCGYIKLNMLKYKKKKQR